MRRKVLLGTLSGILLILIFWGLFLAARPSKRLIQGELELEEIDVAAKVPGRIGAILVTEGDQVQVGSPLIVMDSPEIEAKIKQAKAASRAASALVEKANNGARPQEVEMAKETWGRAQAGANLAQKTYNRVQHLYQEGLLSQQKKDEAYANYINYRDQAAAAKAQYLMAVEGARVEDKKAAQAQAERVQGIVDEAHVAEEEAHLRSPINGMVAKVIAKKGEIMPQGVALVTLAIPEQQTLYFNVKETELSHFAVGTTFQAEIPALGQGKHVFVRNFKVIYSSPLPDFATWRPTKNTDGFDVKTFEVKAKPLEPIPKARSGISVLIRY
ncbi:MAG: biotin/lipoyl-binding protein [Neisseriaceae bacterium]